jgi:parallel beta-helix repeat protein
MRLSLLIIAIGFLLSACASSRIGIAEQVIRALERPQWRVLDRPHVMSNCSGVLDQKSFGGADVLLSTPLPAREMRSPVINGVQLEFPPPDKLSQTAVDLDACTNLNVEELTFRHFKVGIYARNCENLVLDSLTFSDMFRQRLHSTPDREDARDWLWPHNNDNREWMTNYGACIVLENCKNCVIRNCSARRTQNGIILDKCEGCQVYNNDFSYCSGWGCALWRSNKNTVAQNRFDYCVRGYSHGVYARGQDSAGILVFEQCCDNVFAYNSATHGGDGFFLYAGHETTQRTGKGGCNRNLVYGNDFSYAVANGIEATFSDGNVFAKNRLIGCDYGIWGGYSYNTLISQNEIADSLTAGVAIEHGHDNWIEGNTFKNDKIGVWLWWDEDKELTGGVYGQNQKTVSENNHILRNRFTDDHNAIVLERSGHDVVSYNEISAQVYSFIAKRWPVSVEFSYNNVLKGNFWGLEDDETGQHSTADPGSTNYFEEEVRSEGYVGAREPITIKFSELQRTTAAPKGIPDTRGLEPLYLGNSGGREMMVIGHWGPIDVVSLAPGLEELSFGQDENRAGVHWVLEGRNTTLLQIVGDQGFDLEIRTINPFVSRVAISPRKPGWFEYQFDFIANVSISLRGTVLRADWSINFWQWTPAEGSDLPPYWDKLVASPPLKTVTKPALEYNIQGGAPEPGVPADHFATVATTEIELPAGSWKLVLTSDDGARLFVDGAKVIERWDIHGPTDDEFTLTIEKPRRVKLRLEHFENTGWAALALRIERK